MNITETDITEPFCTICDLVSAHGICEVLKSLANLCEFSAEEEECPDCRSRLRATQMGLEVILATVWAPLEGQHEEENEPCSQE